MVGKAGAGPEEAHILAKREVSYRTSWWGDLVLGVQLRKKVEKWVVVRGGRDQLCGGSRGSRGRAVYCGHSKCKGPGVSSGQTAGAGNQGGGVPCGLERFGF